jgi:hypothetical protein
MNSIKCAVSTCLFCAKFTPLVANLQFSCLTYWRTLHLHILVKEKQFWTDLLIIYWVLDCWWCDLWIVRDTFRAHRHKIGCVCFWQSSVWNDMFQNISQHTTKVLKYVSKFWQEMCHLMTIMVRHLIKMSLNRSFYDIFCEGISS